MTRTVLFLCTGNSCRSQMAEGIVNHRCGGRWRAVSAGTRPAPAVNPHAVAAMAEIGIDIASQRPKHADEFRHAALDLVVTLCGNADRDCPAWAGPQRRVHIGFDDPAEAVGTEEQIMAVYRRVRDEIRERITAYLASLP